MHVEWQNLMLRFNSTSQRRNESIKFYFISSSGNRTHKQLQLQSHACVHTPRLVSIHQQCIKHSFLYSFKASLKQSSFFFYKKLRFNFFFRRLKKHQGIARTTGCACAVLYLRFIVIKIMYHRRLHNGRNKRARVY